MENSSSFGSSTLFRSGGLFAAADDQNDETGNNNPFSSYGSFKLDATKINNFDDLKPLTSKQDEHHKKRKHKKEKKKKSKKSRIASPEKHSSKDRYESPTKSQVYLNEKRDSFKKCQLKQQNNDLFKIDRKYDKDNLQYESLYPGDVSKYRLAGLKRFDKKNKIKRYFNINLENLQNQSNISSQSSVQSSLKYDLDQVDFTKLVNDEIMNEQSLPASSNDNFETNDKIIYDNPELHDQMKEFNSNLNRNPNDVDKWIEFIQFQDEYMFELNECKDLRSDKSRNSKKARMNNVYSIERKLEVIEKALKSNPSDTRLLIFKLHLLKESEEPDELSKRWEKLAFINPTNFEIMSNYLKYIITHIGYFNITRLDNFFRKYIEKIIQYQEGHLKPIKNESSNEFTLERSMLQLLLLFTTILKQCGFIERAISIWQAIIEFNWNKPDFLTAKESMEDWKEYFEIFWSSGEAGFGEKGSIGWKRVLIENKDKTANEKDVSDERLQMLSDKENEIVRNSSDMNEIWFEIELLREKYNWLSAKLHEENDDPDHAVLFEDISPFLFRFKDDSSYQNCLLYFLYFLNAIHLNDLPNLDICLPSFCLTDEEMFLKCENSKLFAPKYFNYDQKLKFVVSVFQQSMILNENKNIDQYDQLTKFYLNFLIKSVKQLGSDQSRKLFKQILKKSSNCNKLTFWKQFAELECELKEFTSAKKIYDQMLVMLINQQSNEQQDNNRQFIIDESLSLVHDFIEFNLKIKSIKHNQLLTINYLKPERFKKEEEMGEEVLIFIYSLLNSRPFKSVEEINSLIQLRAIQKIKKLFDDCFKQVVNIMNNDDGDGESFSRGDKQSNLMDNEQFFRRKYSCNQQVNNLIYLIVLEAYICYFCKLLVPADQSLNNPPIKILEKTSTLINEKIVKIENATELLLSNSAESIRSKSIINHLIECTYEKHLDLHLIFLKYNFGNLKPFNELLNQALKRYPTNRYFLTLLANTQNTFRLMNGQIEKFTTRLCRKIHHTTLQQWLFVIYAEMQRLSNIQQSQSIGDLFGSNNNNDQDVQDHSGRYSIGLSIRIRNIFEKALQVHNCLLLWRMYLHFELSQNNLEQAKTIFYLAIQQCPWNKLLYMDGVKIFTMVSTTIDKTTKNSNNLIQNVENLDGLLDLMIEKQLRVRTAVEEVKLLKDNREKLS